MKERVRFVLEWEKRWDQGEGVVNMSELCREFGVSRESGYKWVNRYKEAGFDLQAPSRSDRGVPRRARRRSKTRCRT